MSEESKIDDPKTDAEAAKDVLITDGANGEDSGEEVEPTASKNSDSVAASSITKKKKSKKAKLKKVLGVNDKEEDDKSESSTNPASKLTSGMVEQLLEMNPSLKGEVAGMDKETAAEKLKKLDVADLLTGMVGHPQSTSWPVVDKATVCDWEEPEGHGFLQVLEHATRPSIRSVSLLHG